MNKDLNCIKVVLVQKKKTLYQARWLKNKKILG